MEFNFYNTTTSVCSDPLFVQEKLVFISSFPSSFAHYYRQTKKGRFNELGDETPGDVYPWLRKEVTTYFRNDITNIYLKPAG